MGGKVKYRCDVGMLNLNNRYLNILKLENCGSAVEFLDKNNH
jgi:hypothetical protein